VGACIKIFVGALLSELLIEATPPLAPKHWLPRTLSYFFMAAVSMNAAWLCSFAVSMFYPSNNILLHRLYHISIMVFRVNILRVYQIGSKFLWWYSFVQEREIIEAGFICTSNSYDHTQLNAIKTLTASYPGRWRKARLFTFYLKLHGDIINRSVIFCNQFIVHLHNEHKIHG